MISTSGSRATRSLRHHSIAVGVVLALVCAACGGSSSDDGDGGDPGSTEAPEVTDAPGTSEASGADDDTPPDTAAAADADSEPDEPSEPAEPSEPLTASFRGVTETELHIGISMLDFQSMADQNLVTEGWGDQQGVYQAYIDDLNDRGGIQGRTVVPHYEFYSPLGSTEAEAACIALTKDVETFAVLGGFLGPAEVANDCIVGQNETILIGGRQTGERLAAANAPWVDTPALRERRLDVFLSLLDTEGMLDGRSVAVIGSVEQEDIYDVAGDTLDSFGITPVLEALNDAPQGDTVASDARWQVLAENIDVSGADTVLLIGSTQGGVRGINAAGLDVEVWVLESTGLENLGSETSADDADGAITVTSLTDQQQWEDDSVAGCIDTFSAAFPDVELKDPVDHVDGDEQWFKSIHLYCRNVALFEILANGAGPNPTQETFQAAIDNAGSFALPGIPFASLGADKPDAGDSFQLAQFDANEGEGGALVSITEVLDGTP